MVRFLLRWLLNLSLLGLVVGCQWLTPRVKPILNKRPTLRSPKTEMPIAPTDLEINPTFQKLTGDGVSIYLPAGYEGGNPERDIEAVAKQLEDAGEEHEDLSETLREQKKRLVFTAFDNGNDQQGFVTNVNISEQEAIPGTSISVLLDALLLNLEAQSYTLISNTTPDINGQPAGRLVLNAQVGEVELTQLVYVLKGEERFWIVAYVTTADEFEMRSPQFEESIVTFEAIASSVNP